MEGEDIKKLIEEVKKKVEEKFSAKVNAFLVAEYINLDLSKYDPKLHFKMVSSEFVSKKNSEDGYIYLRVDEEKLAKILKEHDKVIIKRLIKDDEMEKAHIDKLLLIENNKTIEEYGELTYREYLVIRNKFFGIREIAEKEKVLVIITNDHVAIPKDIINENKIIKIEKIEIAEFSDRLLANDQKIIKKIKYYDVKYKIYTYAYLYESEDKTFENVKKVVVLDKTMEYPETYNAYIYSIEEFKNAIEKIIKEGTKFYYAPSIDRFEKYINKKVTLEDLKKVFEKIKSDDYKIFDELSKISKLLADNLKQNEESYKKIFDDLINTVEKCLNENKDIEICYNYKGRLTIIKNRKAIKVADTSLNKYFEITLN